MNFMTKVLLPIGLPVVGLGCRLKEDIFLNTAYNKAKGLESAGNWILTPARYLLAGKKITRLELDTNSCTSENAFTYKDPTWIKILKTALAILVFAPSMILGSTIKGLAYLSETTRKRHRVIWERSHVIHNAHEIVAQNKEQYKALGIETEIQGSFNNPNPLPKPKLCDPNLPAPVKRKLISQQTDAKALGAIGKILTEAGILWWVDCGTCLGVYRHNGIIPWDLDLDIALLAPDHKATKYLLRKHLPKDKFDVWDFSSGEKPGSLLKIRIKETNMLVDIYHYTAEKEKIEYEFSYLNAWWMPEEAKKREKTHSYTPDVVFPLKKATFDGEEVLVPNKLEEYLTTKYGENLDPCRIWDETKKDYVKVEGHPYFEQSAYNE